MVLTIGTPRFGLTLKLATWAPRVLVWGLLLGVLSFIAYSYVDNPKDGPYGVCYESRGRPIPCELQAKQKK